MRVEEAGVVEGVVTGAEVGFPFRHKSDKPSPFHRIAAAPAIVAVAPAVLRQRPGESIPTVVTVAPARAFFKTPTYL